MAQQNNFEWLSGMFRQEPRKRQKTLKNTPDKDKGDGKREKAITEEAFVGGILIWVYLGMLWKALLAFVAIIGVLDALDRAWKYWLKAHLTIPFLNKFRPHIAAACIVMVLAVPAAYAAFLLGDAPTGQKETKRTCITHPMDPGC